ncbi:MAG TPA: hypothetical protein VFL36_21775 [Myxococcales bacterium]|nr:hypothetical protein [Myxococcales bacterium]
MAEKVLIDAASPANDDGPAFSADCTARVAAHIDDPCGEGGFDTSCRDGHGNLCGFHHQFCHGPDYPCVDLLRHQLAVRFLEEIAKRRSGERSGS